MPRSLTLTLASVAALATALAGCSSDSDPVSGTTAPATVESTDTASTPVTPSGSASPEATPTAACEVPGFVPRTKIVLRSAHPVVVYAHRVSVPPASSWRGRGVELGRLDLVPLRVRPDDPGAELTAAQRHQILASGSGEIEGGRIPDVVRGTARIHNDSARNHSYLVYRGSFRYAGTWTIRDCQGTSVRRLTGTYSTVSSLRPVRVAVCGEPASDSRLDRHAARRACGDR